MARIQITVLFVLSMFLFVGTGSQASAQSFACPVTKPNGKMAPGQTQDTMGGQWYGNGDMWTLLWPDGTVKVVSPGGPGEVLEDGSLSMKFPWWLGPRAEGKLTITGKRLDAWAPPLRARIPDGYGPHFQATGLVFPMEGCWEITGRAGHASLTFVTRVVKIQATQQR